MKKWYGVTVSDAAWYPIEAETAEEAKEKAVEWFAERKPIVHAQIINYNLEERKLIL